MIEFKGSLNGKALIHFVNKFKKMFIVALFISSVLVSILYTTAVFIIFLFSSLIIIACPAKWFATIAPNRIYIDLEDRTIVSEIVGSRESFRMIDDTVKVSDYGDFYTFNFNSKRDQYNFIVQKDLITQGTIEEFEQIFEEVLVRVK
ncbi:MAG: hypothetical protein ACI3XL_04815 [Eubacteriales bacterium]